MKNNRVFILNRLILSLTGILFFAVFAGGNLLGEQKEVKPGYLTKIKEWQQKRLKGLKAKDSWLSLAGLFWLQEGRNTFGSDPVNDLVISDVKAPAYIGFFFLEQGQISFKAAEGEIVLHGDEVVFEIPLKSDAEQQPTILSSGSLSWFIIKRGERLGVRLRDSKHPRIAKLKEIETFPIDPKWRVAATLERYEKPLMIKVPTVLGSENDSPTPGVLLFEIAGKIQRLTPIGADGDLFVIFGDETNAGDTYGGGRFLSVAKPDEQGRTFIDFNMAVNPPCAFSTFATCPLPPKMNRLTIRVTAGEKVPPGPGGH